MDILTFHDDCDELQGLKIVPNYFRNHYARFKIDGSILNKR